MQDNVVICHLTPAVTGFLLPLQPFQAPTFLSALDANLLRLQDLSGRGFLFMCFSTKRYGGALSHFCGF